MSIFLQQFLEKKVVVFGTGRAAEELTKKLWFSHVECFIDNNPQKRQELFEGKEVLSPEDLLEKGLSEYLVIVASMYYPEIASQLKVMGLIENMHFFDAKEVLFHIYGQQQYPAGHYYSIVPDRQEAIELTQKVYDVNGLKKAAEIPGIDLNTQKQIELFNIFAENYYPQQPFTHKEKKADNRYFFNNGLFESCDAITLYCMIRRLKPKKIVEIGSGFSSAVILDTNQQFLDYEIELTFIEPYPERLNQLLNANDKQRVQLIQQPVQKIDLELYKSLQAGDILFIDSTHVSRIGSDVNHIIFNILPILNPGVFIHFHDIFFPFTYPINWLKQGRFWNEAYLLRAFLQFNNNFTIRYWSSYLHCYYDYISEKQDNLFVKLMPLCQNSTGGSLWLEKL